MRLDGSVHTRFLEVIEACFFTEERLDSWRAEMFRDSADPTKLSDGCHNLISLSPDAHSYWERALFALRPVSLSDDEKTLTVELYWQKKPSHGRFDTVDLLETPHSSKGLTQVERSSLAILYEDGIQKPIHSGDVFILTTHDPQTHPLPSFGLLEMQWHLSRIVSMSGAAEVLDEDDDSDDDDFGAQSARKSSSEVMTWLSSLPSSDYHKISNNSYHSFHLEF